MADYCNISIFEVGSIGYYDYLLLLRDAVIHSLSQTKSGRDYLNNAWILTQTEPDRKALRKKFGREEERDGE